MNYYVIENKIPKFKNAIKNCKISEWGNNDRNTNIHQ